MIETELKIEFFFGRLSSLDYILFRYIFLNNGNENAPEIFIL